MCRGAVSDESDPHQCLLPRLEQICALSVQVDRVATDLADGFVGAGEQLGMLVHHPVRAVDAAVLLVREERDDEVTGRLLPRLGKVAECGQDHRIHVLHVDGTPAPQQAVADLAAEGVDAPVGSDRRHNVEVAVHDQRRAFRVATGYPCHDTRASGGRVEQVRGQSEPLEFGFDVLCRLGLALGPSAAPVHRLETDQVTRDPCGRLQSGGSILIGHETTLPALTRRVGRHVGPC